MDHKELGTNSSVSTSFSDGNNKFAHTSPTVQASRNKAYDVGSNSLGKVDTTAGRPCAIIGPDRVLPHNTDDMYLKKMPGEAWSHLDNIYRRPPDYPSKMSDFQPTRNISPRQTFQENMQRIMVPPMFSSMKSSDESSLKSTKLNMPQEAKYCDVPYNINSVNSERVRNSDIPMSNVNTPYTRNIPPPYGWPAGVNVRPLKPYGASEFYQYQEFPSCAGPRPMTMIRPHRPLHEESAQVYSERLYQDANIRFKPYPTGKEKHQQPRYDYISNYPNTFHPPAPLPPHKYDMHKTIHGYPVYPPVPIKYLDRRMHEPFVDGYHRTHNQQANFNAFHNQVVPPPYVPIPGNCMQNKSYSDATSKSININKMQFENNNKVYLNLESRNKNYPVPENLYYNDMNHSQAVRGEIVLPTHSTVNIHPVPQHSIYRKDSNLKPYDYNPNYRIFDHVNHSLQRIPLQFSPNTISPSDSNTSNDTAHTIGTSQDDCGYVSQSSTASIRSLDSGNIPMSHDIYRRHNYNNYDMFRNTFHSHGPIIPKNKTSSPNKKNINVRQFLQMWNEGDEEVSEGNKEAAAQKHAKKLSQNEIINNQEQLYVLDLVNVPSEELGKYDHIQKISKLPENIKGYNSLEILNQYEELLETPHNSYNKSREYNAFSRNLLDKEITSKLPRPISPLDVEAKISQSVIHKEVGCNFEIKPCSPEMLNVELAAPVQNILGERMIEKVINPIMTKSPILTRCENTNLQNTANDAVKVASCKMLNDQYSSINSPNQIRTSNYSVQHLESNADLCLASLPQLDNDIELNFPEINQQFIKANQMESNITPGLQNLLHIDLEQSNHCLPREVNNDSRQHDLSPQLALGSVADKEFSKLSKYRKGRKHELTSKPNITKEDTIKVGDSMAALQRIDSVIIKNPDNIKSQYNDTDKISKESNFGIQKESKQSYSSLKYESNIDRYDLSSDTAIDFSLNRSEDETAVRYLNAIDRNESQNLPPLEGFDEKELNADSLDIPNAPAVLNIMSSSDFVDELHSDRLQFKMTKEYKNKQNFEENKYDDSKVKSHKVNEITEEYDVLVMKKLATAEQEIPPIGNDTSKKNIKNNESPVFNIENIISVCQEPNEESLFTNPIDTVQSKYEIEIEKVEPESVSNDQSKKEVNLSVETIGGGQCNRDKSMIDIQNEIVSNIVPDISIVANTSKGDVDKKYNKDDTNKHTIEKVHDDLSNQSIGNLKEKSDLSHQTKNYVSEHFINEEITDNKLNISVVSSSSNETISEILEKSYIGISGVEKNCIDVYQSVTSKPYSNGVMFDGQETELAAVVDQNDSKKDINNTADIISSTDENIAYDKIESNVAVVECVPETVLKLTEILPQQDKTKIHISGFKCLSDKKHEYKCNETDLSMSTETCLATVETKHRLVQNDCATKQDPDLAVEIAACDPETVLWSTEILSRQDNTRVDVPGFQCLSDKTRKCNCNETDLSMSTDTCLVTEETKHDSARIDCATKQDAVLAVEIVACDTETVLNSTEIVAEQNKTRLDVSRFKCLSDHKNIDKCNEIDLSMSTETCLATVETKHHSVQNDCATKQDPEIAECNPDIVLMSTEILLHPDKIRMDTSGFDCLSDKTCIYKYNERDLSMSTDTCLITEETKHAFTQNYCATKQDGPNVECLSNESYVKTSDLINDTCILTDKKESITSSSVKLIGSRQKMERLLATQEKMETHMDISESKYLYSRTDIHDNTTEVPCSYFTTTPFEKHNVINAECNHNTDIGTHQESKYEMNKDAEKSNSLFVKSCTVVNVEESCMSTKNITSVNLVLKNAEVSKACNGSIDIAESEILSCKPYINSYESVRESSENLKKNLSNKITFENLSVKIIECEKEIEEDYSVQKDYDINADTLKSQSLPDLINNIDDPILTISNQISLVSSNEELLTQSKLQTKERKDSDLIKVPKLDVNYPGLDPNNGLQMDKKNNNSTSELKDKTKLLKIENNSLQICKSETYLKLNETRQSKKYAGCHKELFSPWIQKLLMFTGGLCKSIINKNVEQEDICSKINNVPFVNPNNEEVLSTFYNMETRKSWGTAVNYELLAANKETNLLSEHDVHVTNEVLQTVYDANHIYKPDNGSLNEKYKSILSEDSKIAPLVNFNNLVFNPRKILKRSLSESALEAYDINLVHPCKRKKGMKENHSFVESHNMTSEDICKIIQTNRRNSISTFYNQENVYIVIDDLILAEENEDSDKLCFTESTEDFLSSIESSNYKINHNLDNDVCTEEPNAICEYSESLQQIEEKSIEESWVDDVACIETVFSEDVAENIIIDVQTSPKIVNSLGLDSVDEEPSVFYDSDHLDKIKSIYGRNMCNDNTQLIETLYRTPQMNVNKTLYHIESQDSIECLDAIIDSCLESNGHTGILATEISSYKVVDNKENMSDVEPLNSKHCNKNIYPNFNHINDCNFKDFSFEEQEDKFKINSCISSNDYLNVQKENSKYSCSSSPEVSSTTSEEKNSSILLKITNCNGSIVSQINEVSTDTQNKLSYKLTEKGEYQSYSTNFSSSRTLITKAAQKYIPPLKETIYDLKVKLPLPQHRLHTLKQLKIAKVEPKVDATTNTCTVTRPNHNISKKQKPKFEDVLKSIDEINFKRHKDNTKKAKTSIPKVIIKKNENGAHYASSKTTNRKETYNPDLTGRKWQPWVFLEKNNFVDKMALQNKVKAVYCHRKSSYVLLEKFRKYKSVYDANFVISQPQKSDTKGNLKYTIRLKHIN